MRLRRWALALVLVLALGSLLVACGSSAPGGGVGVVGQGVILHQDGNRVVVTLLPLWLTTPSQKASSRRHRATGCLSSARCLCRLPAAPG